MIFYLSVLYYHTFLSEKSSKIAPLIEDLCTSLAGKKKGYEFMVQGYLYQLLGIIINEHLYEDYKYENVSSERLASMKNVLLYISENYSNNISLETLSKIAGMNPKYFCRYFKKNFGKTFIEYVNSVRLSHIHDDLIKTNLSVSKLMELHGFANYRTFIKMFHAAYGCTPSELRASQK